MVTKDGKPAKQLHDPCGCHPCLDFVNSVDRTVGVEPPESLREYTDLLLWSTQAGTLPERRARRLARASRERPREAVRVLARARALREAVFEAFQAVVHGEGPAPEALALVNAELARSLCHARVAQAEDGFEWTWEDAPAALDAPLWPLVRSAAELLVSPERERVKQCAGETCLWLFLDRSKNHLRRWCEMRTCGNRAKVREHRRRKSKRPRRSAR